MGVFIDIEKYKRNIQRNKDNNKLSHIYYYNNRSGSDRESHTSLSFLDHFLLVLARPALPSPSYWVAYCRSNCSFSLLYLLISVTQDLYVFFLLRESWMMFLWLPEALCYAAVSDHSRSKLMRSYS